MAELEGTLKTWQKKVGDGVVVDEEVEIDKLCLRSFIVASSNATRVFEPGRLYKPQACLTTAIHRRAAHGHGSCGFPSDHSWQRIYDLVLSPHSLAITLPNNLSIARVVPTLSGLSVTVRPFAHALRLLDLWELVHTTADHDGKADKGGNLPNRDLLFLPLSDYVHPPNGMNVERERIGHLSVCSRVLCLRFPTPTSPFQPHNA
jgi:hypothetical protein